MMDLASRNDRGARPVARIVEDRRGRLERSASARTIMLLLAVQTLAQPGFVGSARADQYWDGDGAGSAGNVAIDGGAGTWNATATNWTDATGIVNSAYNPAETGNGTVFGRSFGLGPAIGGAVTVDNGAGQIVLTRTVTFTSLAAGPIYTIGGGPLEVNTNGTTFNVANVSGDSGTDAVISSDIVSQGVSPNESITKTGVGTLTLSGTNSYGGDTIVNGGILEVTGGNAITDTSDVSIGNAGTLRLLGDEVIGSLDSGGSGARIELGGRLTTQGNGATSQFDGDISGTGGLAVAASGTLILTGNNTYTGATIVTGDLEVRNGNAIGASGGVDSTVVIDGGRLTVTNSERIGSLFGNSGAVITADNQTLTINQTLDSTFGADFAGRGTVNKTGAGTLTLNNNNAFFDGVFNLQQGTLRLANQNALGDANDNRNTVASGGTTLDYASTVTIGEAIVLNGDVSFNQDGAGTGLAEQSGTISGSGGLIKTGDGLLTLSGSNNSYSGGTRIAGGTLETRGGSALRDDDGVRLDDVAGARLLVSTTETIGTLDGGGANGGTVEIASGQRLTVNQASNEVFGGAITGGGALTKNGTGSLTLTNTVDPGGDVVIQNGTLGIGNGGTGGELLADVSNNGELAFNRSDDTRFSGDVTGSGFVTARGSGTLTLDGDIANTEGLDLGNGATVVIGDTGSVTTVNDGKQAVQVFGGSTASLTNNGTISAAGNASAILNDGQRLDIVNSGTISSGNTAVNSNGELRLENAEGGRILGGGSGSDNDAVFANGTASIVNAGAIEASAAGGHAGVVLSDGGTLTNTATGRIFGGAGYAIIAQGPTRIESAGRIDGGSRGAVSMVGTDTIELALLAGSTTTATSRAAAPARGTSPSPAR